jgi:hypothetical protein
MLEALIFRGCSVMMVILSTGLKWTEMDQNGLFLPFNWLLSGNGFSTALSAFFPAWNPFFQRCHPASLFGSGWVTRIPFYGASLRQDAWATAKGKSAQTAPQRGSHPSFAQYWSSWLCFRHPESSSIFPRPRSDSAPHATIAAFTRCTVLAPLPVILAVLRTLWPAFRFRTMSLCRSSNLATS